ncbi:hypothetical protein [Frankia sp. Cr1]|uniref:hypothetical protein n=1 Tax=Frankia sp. Cr1 TaxID=3073931 RepID=UPI002AD47FE2|nr:hypothetical protein [Frankia sp. Cr1]
MPSLAVGALILGAVVFLGFLIAAQVAMDRAGCGSVDPTDPGNYSEVVLSNDTPRPVVVDDCRGGYCRSDQGAMPLAPGQRVQVQVQVQAACAASGDNMTSWRVTSTDGAVLGYVAVDTPRKQDGLSYPISRIGHDRTTATPAL